MSPREDLLMRDASTLDAAHAAGLQDSSATQRELLAAIAAIAAYGLPGRTGALRRQPLGDARWRSLLAAVNHQRLAGHLVETISTGALPTTSAQANQARELHLGWLRWSLCLERLLLDIVWTRERARIEYRVFKGPAIAHLAYPNPSYEVDLHRTFAQGPFGFTVDLATPFQTYAPLRLGGRTLRTLDLEPIGLSTWATTYAPSRQERQALDVYLRQPRRFAAMALHSLRAIPHPADKVAYLRSVLVPQRAAISYYDCGYRTWWRRGIDALRGRGIPQ